MLDFITWTADPAIFTIGSREIRWYGLAFAIGFAIGYMIVERMWKKEGLPPAWIDSLLIYTMLGTVIGARLGHCLFYAPEYYLANPIEIFKIWEGGLASHGGTLGIIIAIYFYSKRVSHKSMLWAFDKLVVPTGLVAAMIRLGNLMNHEIYGHSTDLPWGFRFIDNLHAWRMGAEPIFTSSVSSQRNFRKTRKVMARTGVVYTEPLSRRFRMSWEYAFIYSRDEAAKTVFLRDNETGELSTTADARQSSENRGIYLTHKIGPRFQYAFRKTSITVGGAFQHMNFKGTNILPATGEVYKPYSNLTYEVVANLVINRQNTIRIDAKGRTVNPSANLLQDVVSLANLSRVSGGNPNLSPSYLHDFGIRYIHTDVRRGSTVAVSLNYNGSGNYIGDSLVADQPDFIVTEGVKLGEGNLFVRPVNIGGYHRLHGKITYGFPVNPLRSNLNIQAQAVINVLPGIINGEYSPVHRNNYLVGTSLASNISEDVDFRVSYTGEYVQGEFTTKAGKNNNDYFSHTVSGQLKWAFWKGVTFTGSLSYRQDKGISAPFNDRTLLCNLYLGKRIFRNRLGEISIGINDLFDDNSLRYAHTINSFGANNIVNQGIGRYVAFQFVWHLRNYRK